MHVGGSAAAWRTRKGGYEAPLSEWIRPAERPSGASEAGTCVPRVERGAYVRVARLDPTGQDGVVTAFLTILALPAQAFQLEGHRVITREAIALEAESCPALHRWQSVVTAANVGEDLNLPVKWGRHSHYYRPVGEVDTGWRSTSEVRVEALAADLESAIQSGNASAAWSELGRILHHVQDMASPPHVVPVKHGLDDPFEARSVGHVEGDREPPPTAGALEAHHALALETWHRVTGDAGLERYWVVEHSGFGDYGDEADAQDQIFDELHADRVEAALAWSRAVLRELATPLCNGG